jgi:hypothetical protein
MAHRSPEIGQAVGARGIVPLLAFARSYVLKMEIFSSGLWLLDSDFFFFNPQSAIRN